jgi:hypothetical protein
MPAKTDLFAAKVMIWGPRLAKDLGLSDNQVAGVFGNFGRETGGFRLLQEVAPTVKGSRGGWGWAQWTGPRRKAFEAWAKANKFGLATDEANYGFLVHELKTNYAGALAALKRAKTVETAVSTFETQYEGAGVKAMAERVRWAKAALVALGKARASHEVAATAAVAAVAKEASAPSPKPKAAAKPAVKKATVLARKARPKRRRA